MFVVDVFPKVMEDVSLMILVLYFLQFVCMRYLATALGEIKECKAPGSMNADRKSVV